MEISESPGLSLNCAVLANDGDTTVLANRSPGAGMPLPGGESLQQKGSELVCGELPPPEAGTGVAPPLMNTCLCYSAVKQACHAVLVMWIDMHSEMFC